MREVPTQLDTRSRLAAFVLASAVLAACGGATATPTGAPVTAMPIPSHPPITISVPAEVAQGATFNASWSGTAASGDFFVIVPAGATT